MPMIVVVGTQWGDEGKGKVVDLLSEKADVVARWNGGANAGHTVYLDGKKYVTHLLPSGLLRGKVCVLGDGMVIDPEKFLKEINDFATQGIDVSPKRVKISDSAHIVLPTHKALDEARERARGKNAIGTTRQGIGPAYADKEKGLGLQAQLMKEPIKFGRQVRELAQLHNRELVELGYEGLQLDLDKIVKKYQGYAYHLAKYVKDTSYYLQQCLKFGKILLAEGAQGTLLDVNHGTRPYITRSSTIASSAAIGLGVDQCWVSKIIGVAKCFQTRVGEGPMPTELPFESDLAKRLRSEGQPGEEKGATTGRPRRVGWLDLPLLRYAAYVNCLDELVLTKLDVLSGLGNIKVCDSYRYRDKEFTVITGDTVTNLKDCVPQYQDWLGWNEKEIVCRPDYQELRGQAASYVQRIERAVGVPVTLVSVGTDRNEIVKLR